MRIIGMDIHRDFAEVVVLDGAKLTHLGRVAMTRDHLDMIVAVGVMAAIGRIDRFASPDALVAYIGLNPSVFQSDDGPAHHGRITKRGRSHARFLLVEAAWQTVRTAGPLRAFYERVRARRGAHIAAVAVARKLAILIWHLLTKGEDYAWASPALMARKHRAMELAAGMPAERGKKGAPADYNLPDRRRTDRAGAELAEVAYRRMVEGWRKTQRRRSAGATTEERL